MHPGFLWGFNVMGLWKDGTTVTTVYAKEVHVVDRGTSKDANTVVVDGSKGHTYTLILQEDQDGHKVAVSCSCPGFRFKRDSCKHIRQYNNEHDPYV